MTVKVAVPIEINDSILTSSDIPEPDPSVGEVAWEDEASRNITYTLSTSVSNRIVYNMTRNNYGELLVIFNDTSDQWGVAKFDANNILVWEQVFGTDTGISNASLFSVGCGVLGDTMILHWMTNLPSSDPNHKKVYEQRITGIAGEGVLPLNYTSSAIELTSIPAKIVDSSHIRLTRSNELIFACYSNNNSNFLNEVDISRLSLDGSEQSFVGTGMSTGNVRAITSDFNGGAYVLIGNDYSDPSKINLARFSTELNKQNSGTVPYEFASVTQMSFYSGVIEVGVGPGGILNQLEITPYSETYTNLGAYKKDDEVVYLPNHTKYICLANETFSNPSETATGDANAEWLKIGPSNRWSMLDKFIKNKTKSTVDFTVEITPGVLFDTVSFFGITGVDTIRVEVLRGTDVIYDETKSFVDVNSIVDWYSYFFYQLTHREEDVFFNIPPYLDTKLRVTFTGTGSGIEVGAMPFGMSQPMGVVCINTKSDTKDYSDIEYDQFGELSEIERPVVSYNTYEIDVKKTLAKSIERKLKDLRGKNALWIGDIGDGQQLITYGRYERSPLTYSNHSIVSYSVKVRGSI